MIKLINSNSRLFLVFFLILVVAFSACICIGCTTVRDYGLPSASQRTKQEVLKIWGPSSKIYTDRDKLKNDADEVWIYKNPRRSYPSEPLIEERLYFKSGILVKYEGVTIDSF